jgi:hypothetical protein
METMADRRESPEVPAIKARELTPPVGVDIPGFFDYRDRAVQASDLENSLKWRIGSIECVVGGNLFPCPRYGHVEDDPLLTYWAPFRKPESHGRPPFCAKVCRDCDKP